MSRPRDTIAPESTIIDIDDSLIALLELTIVLDSSESEDGESIASSEPEETGTGEDGGGSHEPPAEGEGIASSEPEETGTGEDGGGSHEPPAEGEGIASSEPDETGTGEDGGGSHEPPSGVA